MYAAGEEDAYLVPDEALHAYMQHCAQRLGDAFYRTPRHTITGFLNLLAVLEQNPDTDWRMHLDHVDIPVDVDPNLEPLVHPSDEDNDLTTVRL